MNKTLSTLLLALVATTILAGRASAQQTPLRIGDTFVLKIGGVPGDDAGLISGSYTVDSEGCLNITYLGKLHIASMLPSQVQNAVERAYMGRGIFTHPTVTLDVQGQARFVNVSGAVKAPTRVPYTPDMTVMSAINAAGDFNDYADPSKTRLVHNGQVSVINCKKARRDPSIDVKVQPGDSIQVPEGFF